MITDVPAEPRVITSSCELQPVTWNSGTEISVRGRARAADPGSG